MRQIIYWFRQDLRLCDNPALSMAISQGHVFPIYIYDTVHPGDDAMGHASRAWTHEALVALNKDLAGKLSCYSGDPAQILKQLCQTLAIEKVVWNRCYEAWQIKRDQDIKLMLQDLSDMRSSVTKLS